jgi:hypothetical protein
MYGERTVGLKRGENQIKTLVNSKTKSRNIGKLEDKK